MRERKPIYKRMQNCFIFLIMSNVKYTPTHEHTFRMANQLNATFDIIKWQLFEIRHPNAWNQNTHVCSTIYNFFDFDNPNSL